MGAPIFSWKAKLHYVVAASSTTAEYIDHDQATKKALWIRGFLQELGEEMQPDAVTIYADSRGAISIGKHHWVSSRTNHIAIQYHLTRNCREKGFINLIHLNSEEMVAEVLTTALPKAKFEYCVRKLGMARVPCS